jgi:hypothetical protein
LSPKHRIFSVSFIWQACQTASSRNADSLATARIVKRFFSFSQARIKTEVSKETIESFHRNKADPEFHLKAGHRKAPSLPVIY